MVNALSIRVEALLEPIDQVETDTVSAHPMAADEATYFTFQAAADARRLRAMGRALL